MVASPLPNDWCEMIREDLESISLCLSEDSIASMSEQIYKYLIKSKMRTSSFNDLSRTQATHSKVRNITYHNLLQPQDYLCDKRFSDKMRGLLFNLRCKTVRGIKDNFHGMYSSVECDFCGYECDDLQHTLRCGALVSEVPIDPEIKYDHIFGTIEQQVKVTAQYMKLLEVREKLLEEKEAYRGSDTGPKSHIL